MSSSPVSSRPAPTRQLHRRWRRPDRATLVLLSALVIAGATYVAAPLLRPAIQPAPGERGIVPAPGVAAPIDGPAGIGGAIDDRLPLAERIAFWTKRVDARADDFLSLAQLAIVHAERARLTEDLSAYEQSLGLIDRSIALVPNYPPTIRARASVRLAIHDFPGAAADAATVLAASPSDATALGLLGDARLELGQLAEAGIAYDRLAAVAPGPWLDIRQARLAYMNGDADGAVELARRARAAATRADPIDAPFYDFALGEFARLAGDATTARAGFEAALAARSDDLGALVGLARIDAFEGRPAAAIAALERAAAIAPEPDTLTLIGDLLALGGDPAAADRHYARVRLASSLGALNGSVYARPLTLFELDHGGAADAVLADARAAVAVRSDAAGHDVVAWALHRLGRFDEAALESDAALAGGIADARILYHAGAIAIARGEVAEGRALVREALALGPALDPLERHEAEALLAGS